MRTRPRYISCPDCGNTYGVFEESCPDCGSHRRAGFLDRAIGEVIEADRQIIRRLPSISEDRKG